MRKPGLNNHPVPRAKPLVFILSGQKTISDSVYERLERSFRPIEFKGGAHIFDCTDYYFKEFGKPLYRRVVSFKSLMDPARLAEYKWVACNIEMEYRREGGRLYNFDIGYLDTDKLVLASFKAGRNKLFLKEGVYGDMLLQYAGGGFSPMPWAFADFQDGRYYGDLLVIREKLKSGLRKKGADGHGR